MSNSALATACWLQDWVNQPSRKSLSPPALIPLLPGQCPHSSRLRTAESAASTHICWKRILFRRPTSPASALSQPFNAHRASIVERFSPIHF
jgi:hypothetical protein